MEKLLKTLSNPVSFGLANPISEIRDMINNLEQLLMVVMKTSMPDKNIRTAVHKKGILYAAQGTGDQVTYTELLKSRDEAYR
jgi:hypothetical protein